VLSEKETLQMKLSKQILMITPMLFILFASGCSKNLFNFNSVGEDTAQLDESGASPWDPKSGSGGDTSSGLQEKPGPEQDFGTAKKEIPDDGATGSFSAEPFVDKSEGTAFGGFEKPGPGPDFGSAPQGMPGDGVTGSFSAEPILGDRERNGLNQEGDAALKPDSEFFREENVGEFDTASRLYEKPGSGPDFGSATQGMPGNGSSGSFSAEPFVEEGGNRQPPEPAEPFLPEKKGNMTDPLPTDEEARRQLPYQVSENLEDINFAFDKFDLDNNSRAILQKNVAYLESHPNARIEIQGHCDERGSNNYNITLGERRALSTKAFLVSRGVDENRIRTISYGEERPFCFESNEKCWHQNRRGHFLVAE
jgi:peptidoglycan-associated lipoprotein